MRSIIIRKGNNMKAIIKQASEVELNGQQSVTYDIVDNDGNVLATGSESGDVDTLAESIRARVSEYKAKSGSEKRLKEGDEIEL